MKFFIQRVTNASVTIDDKVKGAIEKGLLVFIGIGREDDRDTADRMIKKLLGLRIFEDENGKTNLSLSDVDGGLLLISQFTLYADCRHGNRPGFTDAALPAEAEALYDYIVGEIKKTVPETACGEFGAEMKVSLVNDGPFTILLDSAEILKHHG